ncbi:hypothetical protein [Desulfurobacterium atlanticum]|uniref:Uncharacterized protein n=1 Tax=Desulfurobacterium atlanticum TaxID=240169 RepID=A0A238Y3X4_9BACT|nr:hypothetical protein [Desulfurobacterium atlanticum]SNR65976.1 hypothetical protein SAMN06265340_102105 [Desulfurobacterium atlanticum]
MPLLLAVVGIVALWLLAKILIPILIKVLILFTLMACISPFVIFTIIGYVSGKNSASFSEKLKRRFRNERKKAKKC